MTSTARIRGTVIASGKRPFSVTVDRMQREDAPRLSPYPGSRVVSADLILAFDTFYSSRHFETTTQYSILILNHSTFPIFLSTIVSFHHSWKSRNVFQQPTRLSSMGQRMFTDGRTAFSQRYCSISQSIFITQAWDSDLEPDPTAKPHFSTIMILQSV